MSKSRKAKSPEEWMKAWSGYTPEPPSEIIIERNQRLWQVVIGSHHLPIWDEIEHRAFPDYTDPLTVAKALKAKAQGPINVVVNL